MVASEEHQDLFACFERLATEVFAEAESGATPSGRERRLWRLPKNVVYYYHNVITREDMARVRPLVEKLRHRAVELINELPERAEARARLAELARSAQERFTFHPWSMGDLELFVSYLDNAAMWAHIPEDYPEPLTLEMAATLIEASNEAPRHHEVHAVRWNGDVIGQARLQFDSSPSPDSAELSYWLAQPYWNRGLTTDFVTLYTYESFRTHPKIGRIFAQVLEGNDSSIRVLEKAGYRQESFEYHNVEKHGRKLSTHVFSVYDSDYLVG